MTINVDYNFSDKVSTPISVIIDSVKFDNDGIGYYEFWGAPCYDKGSDYVSELSISEVKSYTFNNKEVNIRKDFFLGIEEFLLENSTTATKINEYFSEE